MSRLSDNTQSSEVTYFPLCVTQNAYTLFLQGAELSISGFNADQISKSTNDSQQLFWSVEQDTLIFSGLEKRNHCAALYAHEQWLTKDAAEQRVTLFSTADDLAKCERETTDFVSGRFLALVNKTTPVIQLAAEAIKHNSAVVFDVLGVLGDALAYMENIDIQAIIDLCEAQHEITKNDLFRGDFPHKLERVLSTNAAWALKLYDEVKPRLLHANTTLYGVSLLSLAKTQLEQAMQLAVQDAGSDKLLLKCSALWVLGRLLDSVQTRIESHQAAIDCVLLAQQSQDETIANAAIQAIAHAAAREASFSKFLVILAEQGNAAALTGLSTNTFYLVHNSSAALSDDVLQALSNTAPSVADAVSSLDCILSKLLERNADDTRVLEFLKTWFSKHGSKSQGDDLIEHFQQTFAAISDQHSQLEKLLTLWLVDENLNVAYAAGALIRWLKARNVEKFSFSKPVLDTLDKPHLLLLTRRLIGHCATHETALFSLALSLLNTDNAKERTHPFVFQLLAYEFGFNYGRWALEQIKAQHAICCEQEKYLFQAILDEVSQYLDALIKLPELPELNAPSSFGRALSLQQHKKTRVFMEKANENSLMSKIATRVPLKAGSQFFSVYKGAMTAPSKLETLEYRARFPKEYFSDPAGFDRKLWRSRNARLEPQ